MEKDMIEKEGGILFSLMEVEDLAEKKAMIRSRLLTDPALAQEMEALSKRHAERKQRLLRLTGRKEEKEGEDET